MSELNETISRFVKMCADFRSEAVERACEEALVGGEHGVLVTSYWGVDGEVMVTAEVSGMVPFGCVYGTWGAAIDPRTVRRLVEGREGER